MIVYNLLYLIDSQSPNYAPSPPTYSQEFDLPHYRHVAAQTQICTKIFIFFINIDPELSQQFRPGEYDKKQI